VAFALSITLRVLRRRQARFLWTMRLYFPVSEKAHRGSLLGQGPLLALKGLHDRLSFGFEPLHLPVFTGERDDVQTTIMDLQVANRGERLSISSL
jgi:hypothetical protein